MSGKNLVLANLRLVSDVKTRSKQADRELSIIRRRVMARLVLYRDELQRNLHLLSLKLERTDGVREQLDTYLQTHHNEDVLDGDGAGLGSFSDLVDRVNSLKTLRDELTQFVKGMQANLTQIQRLLKMPPDDLPQVHSSPLPSPSPPHPHSHLHPHVHLHIYLHLHLHRQRHLHFHRQRHLHFHFHRHLHLHLHSHPIPISVSFLILIPISIPIPSLFPCPSPSPPQSPTNSMSVA